MLQLPTTSLTTILTALKGTGGLLNGVKVHLYKNNVTPVKDTPLSSFVEADFGGYAASAVVTWSAPYAVQPGGAEMLGTLCLFQADGTGTGNVIFGYYITSGDGATLIASERFDQQIGMGTAGDTLPIIPRFAFGQSR